MDKKTSEPVNFKKVFIIIVVIWTIISILIYLPSTINYYKKHNINNNEEIKEQDRIQEEKKQERIQESIHNGIDIKLLEMGFKEDDDYCPETYTCLTNGQYKIEIGNVVWVNIERELDKNKPFDSKDDLLLIGKLYNNEKITTRSNLINNIYNSNNGDYAGGFINIDGLHFYISRTKYTITYSIGYYEVEDDLELDIDSLDLHIYEKNYDRIKPYSFVFGDYKNKFPLYDFVNNYKKYADKKNITIDMHNNYYRVKETLNYYTFVFEKRGYSDTQIQVNVPSSLFEENNIKLINNDLKYFNNKFDRNYKLSNSDIDSIMSTLSGQDKRVSINLDNLTITIENYSNIQSQIIYDFN